MPGFSTNAIHAGQEPDPHTGAVITPIHPSTTFAQDGVGGLRAGGYEYARSANPTRTALQECLAALEGGRHGLAFGSGMGATDVLMRVLLKPGDHVVIPHDAYGGTFRIVDKVLARWGVRVHAGRLRRPGRAARGAAPEHPAAVVRDARPTRCWASPTSPRSPTSPDTAGARLVVDNTFASPYLQTPLALGADVVLHSTTKYVGGHSDVVGGALVTSDDELAEELHVHPERHRLGARPVRRLADPARGEDPGACGWSGTATTPSASPSCSPGTRRSSGCSTRACPTTPATRSRPSRCGASAAWCRSPRPAAARRRCGSARRPSSSPWPSRWAGWSR